MDKDSVDISEEKNKQEIETHKSKKNHAAEVIKSISKLSGLAGKAGSSLAAFAAFSYCIGWFYSRTYYNNIGAPWIIDMISPAKFLQSASFVLLFIFVTIWIYFDDIFEETSEESKGASISKKFIISFICLAIGIIGIILFAFTTLASLSSAAMIIGLFGVASVIALIVYLVIDSISKSDQKFGRFPAASLLAVAYFSLYGLPTLMGIFSAEMKSSGKSSGFPIVKISGVDNSEFRAVEMISTGAVVCQTRPDGRCGIFKIVPHSELVEIKSTR